jgi:HEPN domain-containing protein
MKLYIHLTTHARYRNTQDFLMTTDSDEWFRQAQYDIDTAESLIAAGRYPPVIFFCHLALEKALKAL